ncbi:MAG TPA: hypothetical protein ENJ82_16890 [Bacteroidetes bacterium]|nr:hypothetical protein [Bacteroidota bacterium]
MPESGLRSAQAPAFQLKASEAPLQMKGNPKAPPAQGVSWPKFGTVLVLQKWSQMRRVRFRLWLVKSIPQ